jgi:hypothetical protein
MLTTIQINQLTGSKRIACIGSTKANTEDLQLCQLIGYTIAKMNIKLASGNAIGADQAYAQGANFVDETLVYLYLTGKNHNTYAIKEKNNLIYNNDHPEWVRIAKENHPKYDYLSSNIQNLFNRNAGIVIASDLVIALPSPNKSWGGGTGHGVKIAQQLGIPVWNIKKNQELVSNLKTFMKSYLKGEQNGRIQT